MRSEQDMFELILETARQDERIRAVIMNGSRANPNAPPDILQDFDIVYLVTDVAPFKHNLEWIERFGELMILQLPDDMQDPPPEDKPGFAYLMQFMDGNRIDLNIYPLTKLNELEEDSLSILLLDKDGIIPPFPPASDSSYLPQPPTAKAYFDCCNEFWWVCPYVAKGLWRSETIYAKSMLDQAVRPELMKMLTWQIGVQTGFSHNPGKFGKYFQQYLEPDLWEMLLNTYTDASYERTWEALFVMCDLFRIAAVVVAGHFDFNYPHDEDKNVSAHLRYLRELPGDARDTASRDLYGHDE
jgi:aminoglycoside 6-adenylyltransferase